METIRTLKSKQIVEMREVYANTLSELIAENTNVICVEADVGRGSKTYPIVKNKFPENFIDVGVAEANLICIGAGLASEGKIPFCGTFTGFATRRPFDQITVSVALSKNNVKIVGYSPGILTTINGATHMCFEDMAIMRTLPGMQIFSPPDAVELKHLMKYMASVKGPMYLQLIRKPMPVIFDGGYDFDPFKAKLLAKGDDLTIVTTGLTTHIGIEVTEKLREEGIHIDHLHYTCIKPFDIDSLVDSARKTKKIITIENQNIIGGLGSTVAETLSEHYPTFVKRLGVPDRFGEVGTVDYLMEIMGFDPKNVFKECLKVVNH